MSRKFKSQASSARAASALTGGFGLGSVFQTSSSPLAYVTEGPDLTQISNPDVVVAFKNLSKRDSTTKAKALEDLTQLLSTIDVEEAILAAWCEIYPRASIDNSRKVRQLAHTIQGTLTSLGGKKIAPLLKKVVGSWLAGIYDGDRVVAKTARTSLEKSFPTAEKRNALWKVYQQALVDYAEDAIIVQSESTLSDERTTSPDDAEAKYVRVVGSGIHILTHLLNDGTRNHAIPTLLSDKKLWNFVTHNDPHLRRSVCQLVGPACQAYNDQLDWNLLSSSFISKGLQANQIGSSSQFTHALIVLTKQHPEIWTSDYTSKTPVLKRLHQLLRKGSQSSHERFWPALQELLKAIPREVWITDDKCGSAISLLEAMRTGISQPSERMNATTAWNTYVEVGIWLMDDLDKEKDSFADQILAPIILSYSASDQKRHWAVPSNAAQLCVTVLRELHAHGCEAVFRRTWSEAVENINNAMKMSLPESSKEFRASQDAVIAQSERLFRIAGGLKESGSSPSGVLAILKAPLLQLLDSALDLLVARNGKPYAAASIADSLVRQLDVGRMSPKLQNFVNDEIPKLINSPSAEQLISISMTCGQTSALNRLLQQDAEVHSKTFDLVLKQITADQVNSEIKAAVQSRVGSLETTSSQETATCALTNTHLKQIHETLLSKIRSSLAPEAPAESQLGALKVLSDVLAHRSSESVFSIEDRQSILSTLLLLVDAGTDTAEQARSLIQKIDTKSSERDTSHFVIQQQLNAEGTPLSIFTLIELAENALKKGAPYDSIFPDRQQWQNALAPHLHSARPMELSITNPLQGMVYSLQPSTSSSPEIYRDFETLSTAFRLALYTTKLLSSSEVRSGLKGSPRTVTQRYVPVAMTLVDEKLGNEKANDLWLHSVPELLQEALDLVSDGNRLVQFWLHEEDDDEFTSHWISRLQSFQDTNVATYCEASAWINVASQIIDQNGPTRVVQQYDEDLNQISPSTPVIRSAALLSVLREPLMITAIGKRISNELVASATASKEDLKPLILLNILLNGQPTALETIPNQRIVFLLKNLVNLLGKSDLISLDIECVKLLAAIAPLVASIYGEHWSTITQYLIQTWQADLDVTLINATLRLYSRLQSLCHQEDANEDLIDAFQADKQALDDGLVKCLFALASGDEDTNQSRDTTAELLRRLLRKTDPEDVETLFRLLSSSVTAVQSAAYDILHRTIPAVQEQLSIDLVLEQRTMHLSEGLLTHLIDPSNSKEYLFAWNIVFDHFPKASHQLRESYVNDIKRTGHINSLLDFICDIIKISSGRPVDASKFDILNFDIDGRDSLERELQYLAICTYYNVLLFLPSLAKDWFISQQNRIKSPLESWTQKYISPAVVLTSVSAVMQWAGDQTDEDKKLEVKSSPKGSEVVASIEIDPENPPISLTVSLSGTYPLDPPTVTSRTRVGVSEKNWQSWLRTFQIIIFSTGSIIEGLIAFRHNVQGALKGQSECAICYSIIGTDKQTPNKKCNTCKNNFHGSCLFRWFKSSNSSSCPLCRNNFNYA